MQNALQIMLQLINDAAVQCSIPVPYRDIQTIERRFMNEGFSFLAITLSDFLDDFMLCLEEGKMATDVFRSFRKTSCLPAFLQGFTGLVFEPTSGRLLDEPSKIAIRSIRQLCSAFKKVKLDCTKERIQNAINDYHHVEHELQESIDSLQENDWAIFSDTARLVMGSVFGEEIDVNSLLPHHGPGSTAEAINGNKKYIPNFDWPARLNGGFYVGDCLYSSSIAESLSKVSYKTVAFQQESPVRVVCVPKTLKKPRVIALEPISMQFTQQAIKDMMVQRIECHPILRGHVNFTKQDINMNLALVNSRSREFATIDLSAASDRVHVDLVYEMLSVNPLLRDLIFMTRSRRATTEVDGHKKTIHLRKFASMGSALCFPVEAIFFYIIIVGALLEKHNLPTTHKSWRKIAKLVYVYGDDILIPVCDFDAVSAALRKYGCRLNSKKSFSKGYFRESCGMDAYDGFDITPTYIRRPLPRGWGDSSAVISLVETINQFDRKGYFLTRDYLRKQVEKSVGKLPTLPHNSEGLGWHFPTAYNNKLRWNATLQRQEVLAPVLRSVSKSDKLTDYSALHKCLLKLELRERGYFRKDVASTSWLKEKTVFKQTAFFDERHLLRSPRLGAFALKRRWLSAS